VGEAGEVAEKLKGFKRQRRKNYRRKKD